MHIVRQGADDLPDPCFFCPPGPHRLSENSHSRKAINQGNLAATHKNMLGRVRVSFLQFSTRQLARSHVPAAHSAYRRQMSAAPAGGNGGKDSGSVWDVGSWFAGKPAVEEAPVAESSVPTSTFDEGIANSFGTSNDVDTSTFTHIDTPVVEEPVANSLLDAANSAMGSMSSAPTAASDAAVKVIADFSPMWPPHVFMKVIDNIHLTMDMPYYQSILLLAVVLRVFMFPLTVQGLQMTAKMQYVKPEMDKINARMLADPLRVENKPQYDKEIQELFAKHKVNPIKPLVVPLFQIPVFMSMFFALREMGDYFPDYSAGGVKWFVDLSAADPTMTLPVVNACLFLTMIELGGESGELQNTAQHNMMRNVFRFMGVAMVPLMMNMPAGLFVYWLGNGSLSLAQIVALKNPNIKAALNIPMPPPPPPPVTEEEAAVTIDIDAVKTDKSPFIKLYEENMRLVEANRKLMEKAAKGGK